MRWNGDSIKASGIIYDEPEFKESSVWLRVELKDNYQGRVLIKTKPYAKNFHYGDEISFEGKLEEPESAGSSNLYLRKRILSEFGCRNSFPY